MQAIINYINKYKEIKSILILLEHDKTFEEIVPIFFSHQFTKVYFYSSKLELLCNVKKQCRNLEKNSEAKIPEIITGTYEYMKGMQKELEIDAVFFDSSVYFQAIQSLIKYKPKWVLGRIWETEADNFSIWEQFRVCSEFIFLQNIKKNNAIRIIDWEKKEYEIELSIVFPVYKVEEYLKKCIETVTVWDVPYIEFIFVDDGSPDNSVEIIKEYQKRDSRIKLIHKKNGGCASARKKGMEEAKGRYIGFVDPDDFINPLMYKKLFYAALSGKYDISYCGYNKYYESSGQVEKVSDALGYLYFEGTCDEKVIRALIYGARVAIWRGIYRKEFLKKNKISFYEDLKRFDDLPFKVETFAKAKSVIAVPEYMYYYRLKRPGQDVACDDERLYVHFDIFKHLDRFMKATKNQQLLDYLQIVKVQTHFYALEKIQKKFRKKYIRQMRIDLKRNASFLRTILILYRYLGKEFIFPYSMIRLHMPGIYWNWLKRKEKKNLKEGKKRSRKLEMLKKMYK